MSGIEEAIKAFRTRLRDQDTQAAAEMERAYHATRAGLQPRLDKVISDIAGARERGEQVSAGWLLRQERYHVLLRQTEAEMTRFGEEARRLVAVTQQTAVRNALNDSQSLARAQAGVDVTWNRVPTGAVENLVGVLQDGSPLRALFDNFGAQAAAGMRKALIIGVATGQGPRMIARAVQEVWDIGRVRAQTISRTETLRAYRESSRQSYEANVDVVESWIWTASLSVRTCPACLAMHGTEHPVSERMGSHPNCRCVMIPKVVGVESPIQEGGEDWLRRQSEARQDDILGVKAAEAWRNGEVTLGDFVGTAQSARWGTTRSAVSFRAAQEAANLRLLTTAS